VKSECGAKDIANMLTMITLFILAVGCIVLVGVIVLNREEA